MNVVIKIINKVDYALIKAKMGYDNKVEYKLNYEKAEISSSSPAVHYISFLFVLSELKKMEFIGKVNLYSKSDLMMNQLQGLWQIKDNYNRYTKFYKMAKTEMNKLPIQFIFHKLKKTPVK